MAGIPNVRLSLASRPENVLLVRQALRGVADTVELDAIELNDISTALSEACNNVVAHAYPGGEGPMEVEMLASAEGLEMLVRDHGCGLRPHASEPSEIGGIGIPVMLALADSVEFAGTDGGGTDVRMRFSTPKAGVLAAGGAGREDRRRAPGRGRRRGARASTWRSDLRSWPARCSRGCWPRWPPGRASPPSGSPPPARSPRSSWPTWPGPTTPAAWRSPPRSRRVSWTCWWDRWEPGSSLDGLAPMLEELTEDHEVLRRGSSELLSLRLSETGPETAPRTVNGGAQGNH